MTAPSTAALVLAIGALGPGGAERVLTTLAEAWQRRGIRVAVLTLSDPETDHYSLSPGINRIAVYRSARSHSLFSAVSANLLRLVALRRALRGSGATTVVAFMTSMNVLTLLATRGLGMRVVVCERNDPNRQPLAYPWRLLRRLLYRYADLVTANSRGAVRSLESLVPRDKLAFVPNPLATARGDARADIPATSILMVAKFTHQKAHDVLLEAFAGIAAEEPDWRLVLIGDGPLEDKLRKHAEQLAIADRIDWLGRLDDPFPYYRAAAIFTLPSRYEGTPNAVLEAMSCGLPVIVSDASPGPLDYVEDGKTGLVVPVEEVAALSQALRRLIHDPEGRRRMGLAAAARVRGNRLDEVIAVWDALLRIRPPADPR